MFTTFYFYTVLLVFGCFFTLAEEPVSTTTTSPITGVLQQIRQMFTTGSARMPLASPRSSNEHFHARSADTNHENVVLGKTKNCSSTVKVFITGINGMIGSHVARALLKKDCHSIHGLIRLRADLSDLHGILEYLNLVYGDITDGPRIYSILDTLRPDYVYHFAAQSVNGISFDIARLTMDVNVQGTLNIFEALRTLKLKPRVLFAGSSTEYGNTAVTHVGSIPETAVLDPVSPYGISKAAGEKIANFHFQSYGIPVVTARLFIQIGVGGVDFLAIHQFCKQIALAETGLSASRDINHGNLNSSRDMTDAADSSEVMILLAERGVAGEAYNVGSGTSMTMLSLIEMAVSLSTVKLQLKMDSTRLRSFDEPVLVANITKLQRLTGWVPRTDLSASLRRILNYWRSKVRVLYCSKQRPCNNENTAELSTAGK